MMRSCLWMTILVAACGVAAGAQPPAVSGESQVTDNVPNNSPPTSTSLPARMQQALEAHNAARAEHCSAPLAWSSEAAAAADEWAQRLVGRGCTLEHSRSAYGENLFMATAGRSSPADVVASWVNERRQYDFRHGGFSMETGHFTQVVWKGTTRLGCAMRTCRGMDLWVCNYDSPGNVQGGYAQNVMATSCR